MYIRTLAVSGTNLFAGAGLDEYGGFFLSTDYGASWAEVNTGRFEPFNFPAVYTLKVSETGLFVGTSDGLFLSTSNGTNWIAVDSGLTCSQVLALAVSGTNLFAGTGWGGIFLSTNNGTSWTPVNDGLPRNKENHTDYVYVQSLVTSGRNLFAGTGYGVFVSDFHGTSWTAVGMSFTSVSALAVSGTNLFAGTYGAGIWRRPLSEMVTSAERLSANLPTHFTLDQNYPNPFNPTTVISGEWTVISDVRLVVYDVLGREVAVLASGRYPPGRYSFTFDGANMASGVYFYRLMAGLYSAERKMVLVR
jgi:hypothetical protein